jgi:hypothetical protein
VIYKTYDKWAYVFINLVLRIEEAVLVFLMLRFLNKKKPGANIRRKHPKQFGDCTCLNFRRWLFYSDYTESEEVTATDLASLDEKVPTTISP